jgi:hypothetical protein
VRAAFDKRFTMWKKLVRIIATEARVPLDLDPKESYSVMVELFWKRTARVDGENVQKAIQDACFPRDRRVVEGHYKSYEHHGFEFAKVYVKKVS